MAALQKIVLGAGCFWCIDAVMRRIKGVTKVEVGFTGGVTERPSYDEVAYGQTGHAEAAQIEFDPDVIPLEVVLKIFLTSHDPTSLNKQGADVGTEYRSLVAYTNDEQLETIRRVFAEAQSWYDKPVVTELIPLEHFYKAEEYHQDFFTKYPQAGYCHVVISPKLAKVRASFGDYWHEPTPQ